MHKEEIRTLFYEEEWYEKGIKTEKCKLEMVGQ